VEELDFSRKFAREGMKSEGIRIGALGAGGFGLLA